MMEIEIIMIIFFLFVVVGPLLLNIYLAIKQHGELKSKAEAEKAVKEKEKILDITSLLDPVPEFMETGFQPVLPIKWLYSIETVENGWKLPHIQSILKSMNPHIDKNSLDKYLLLRMQYDFEKRVNQYIKKD